MESTIDSLKGCGLVNTYLAIEEAPAWVSPRVCTDAELARVEVVLAELLLLLSLCSHSRRG
jgi:hypothetical protein